MDLVMIQDVTAVRYRHTSYMMQVQLKAYTAVMYKSKDKYECTAVKLCEVVRSYTETNMPKDTIEEQAPMSDAAHQMAEGL